MMKDVSKLFTCSQCGNHRIEAIMVGVTLSTDVISIDNGDAVYGGVSTDGGHIECFQCMICGRTIVGITTIESLFHFLSK